MFGAARSRISTRSSRTRSRESAPAGAVPRADRVGELREPARARRAGIDAHEQVRRRLSGRAPLRGCELADVAESLAIERAQRLFGAGYANVQPYSGSQANLAAFWPCSRPATRCSACGPRTAATARTAPPRISRARCSTSCPTAWMPRAARSTTTQVAALARKHRPKLVVAGLLGVLARRRLARFRAIADEVGALFLADIAHVAGLDRGRAVAESRAASPTSRRRRRTRRCAVRAAA